MPAHSEKSTKSWRQKRREGAALKRGHTLDEAAFAVQALATREDAIANTTLRLGVAFNILVVIMAPIIGDPVPLPEVQAAGAMCGTIDLLAILFLRHQRFLKAKHVTFTLNIVLIAAFTRSLSAYVAVHAETQFLLGTNSLMTLASILIILNPLANFVVVAQATIFWLVTAAFFPVRPEATRWLMIYAIGLIFSVAIQRMQVSRSRREAVLEYRARQAEIRAASMRVARDLELAREIQDSMAPPAHSKMPEGSEVFCSQLKYEKIAGDWMTVRRFPDGSLVLVLVDATGKGMQAALVVHAIQSLWATILGDDHFDPRRWLELVNQALGRLGEKQPHSATSGIAVIKGQRITYWSAGHLPLFLLLGDGETFYKPLHGKGNILGTGAKLDLVPQWIDLAPNLSFKLMLASDGVLEKGTLTQKRDVDALWNGMKESGPAFLEGLPSADDKTLIMVEMSRESGRHLLARDEAV